MEDVQPDNTPIPDEMPKEQVEGEKAGQKEGPIEEVDARAPELQALVEEPIVDEEMKDAPPLPLPTPVPQEPSQ